jgi:hypothetical protein
LALRDLEGNGFVTRTVTPSTPPQVEYALTGLGRDFLNPVHTLANWVIENAARIEAARAAYAAWQAASSGDAKLLNMLGQQCYWGLKWRIRKGDCRPCPL